MSQGPPASRPSSSQYQDDRYQTLPPLESRTLPPINDKSQATVSNALENATKTTPAQSPINQKTSRSIGMQNILNPASKESSEESTQRRRADHLELPSPATVAASRAPSISITPSSGTVSLPSITPPSMHAYLPSVSQGPRQILTPRSTSAYTPKFIPQAIPGTIDAKTSPFVGSSESASSTLPESSHLSDHQSVPPVTSLPFNNPFPTARSPPGRRPSGGSQMSAALDRRASLAGSDSPSTTYSSYSQYSQTPPITQSIPPPTQRQPSSAFFGVPYAGSGGSENSMPPIPPHSYNNSNSSTTAFNNGPVSTTSSSSSSHHHPPHHQNHHPPPSPYQIYTLDTSAGPIHVPVDVQAASKVADEKRKRNATASHRFRQRRKEKEMETSRNIEKLEAQIAGLTKEKEFYRAERDYFRGIVVAGGAGAGAAAAGTGSLGGKYVAKRPMSPRLLQSSTTKDGGRNGQWQQQQGASDDNDDDHHHHGDQGGRNTRRRTSAYIPSTQDLPPVAIPQQHHHHHHQAYPQLQPAKTRADDHLSSHPQPQQQGRTQAQPVNNPPMWHPAPSSSSASRR
ncbi:MAG: hypothetical protein L6R40_000325 [Gallowayella cf. fulva]|nr:MAG: hypothetical protein L6R40_000325 [Xanthomendoza cf. fulva]